MALTMKRVTDLQEKTEILDEDLFATGNNGTPSLRKIKWSAIWNRILSKIRSDVIVNNKITTDSGYALDARIGKDIQGQIDSIENEILGISKKTSKTWVRDYVVSQTKFLKVLNEDGTSLYAGNYIIEATVTEIEAVVYHRWFVRFNALGEEIYEIDNLKGTLQAMLRKGGGSQLLVSTNSNTTDHTVRLKVTELTRF